MHIEDCSHALFFCPNVQIVWASDPYWQWLLAMQGRSALEIFKHALEEDKDPSLLAFTGWALWNCRNQIRFNEVACPLNRVLQVSKERKLEFQLLHPVTPKLQHRKHNRWKPPDVDRFKVNYDGATFNEQGKAGIGIVICNSEGVVMASLSQQVPCQP